MSEAEISPQNSSGKKKTSQTWGKRRYIFKKNLWIVLAIVMTTLTSGFVHLDTKNVFYFFASMFVGGVVISLVYILTNELSTQKPKPQENQQQKTTDSAGSNSENAESKNTQENTPTSWKVGPNNDARSMLALGYLFVFYVFFCVLYFSLSQEPRVASGTPVVCASDEKPCPSSRRALIGFVPGCDFSEPSVLAKSSVPGEESNEGSEAQSSEPNQELRDASIPKSAKYCGNLPPQWVLTIGSIILDCHVDGTCHHSLKRLNKLDSEKCKEDSKNCEQHLSRVELKRELASLQQNKNILEDKIAKELNKKRANDFLESALGFHAGNDNYDSLSDCSPTSTSKSYKCQRDEALVKIKEYDVLLNQSSHTIVDNARLVSGGIVVPFYFVALAVIGALIAMARKLPEFQSRLDPNYDKYYEGDLASGQEKAPPLDYSQVPELVIFQVLQVTTAPLVAVVVFSFAKPEEVASTAILGFFAGFSTEAVLMALRRVGNHLIGLAPRGPRLRKVLEAREKERKEILESVSVSTSIAIDGGSVSPGDKVLLEQSVGVHQKGNVCLVIGIEGEKLKAVPDGASSSQAFSANKSFFKVLDDTSYINLTSFDG